MSALSLNMDKVEKVKPPSSKKEKAVKPAAAKITCSGVTLSGHPCKCFATISSGKFCRLHGGSPVV